VVRPAPDHLRGGYLTLAFDSTAWVGGQRQTQRQFPGTFSVPARYLRHMMVVADLASGNADAIADALEAAWQLQKSAD
jgi:hypothetical protein